ncbi:hypothetical protein AURDEDRAFT_176561 [Auricularia subglabra TFB-10046 SS5]|uniref:F-box domain-containing protein n=1 Tax=Auricularia subglabra (strain TFB-10046 / SS5) TaxID=717982 RepID=J0CVF4_AURST|nr:hypothetical protein AURDEDRAFT_176561 [Auricularia subglabra TFB-10046 SS5]
MADSSDDGQHDPIHEVFQTVELWDEIWSYILDCCLVCASRRVSRKWKSWLNVTLRRRYDYDRFLSSYFPEELARREFRDLQATHGAIISGSKALDFLGCFAFACSSNTDIYATYDGVVALGNFFLERGFTYQGVSWVEDILDVSDDRGESDSSADVVKIFKFHAPSGSSCNIDLFLVADSPMATILHFPSTIDMNGLLWDRAFSAFPLGTMKHRRGLLLHGKDAGDVIINYHSKGFELHDNMQAVPANVRRAFSDGVRSFASSSNTWTYGFDTPADVQPVRRPAPLSGNSFALATVHPNSQGVPRFWMFALHFEHARLQHAYVIDTACKPFARVVLDYVAEHMPATPRPTCRVRIYGRSHRLGSWDGLMPFVSAAWLTRSPLYLQKGCKAFQFTPAGSM